MKDKLYITLSFLRDTWVVWFVFALAMANIIFFTKYPPGVGEHCKSCRLECEALGKKLNTESKYINTCWIKNWSHQ